MQISAEEVTEELGVEATRELMETEFEMAEAGTAGDGGELEQTLQTGDT